jgi:polar amino acid transport system substrate-binding protein
MDCGDKPIRLALYSYGYFYDKNTGIDKDIVDELIRRSGCRFEISVRTRARIWNDLESGDLHMSVSGIQTPERDRFAWFIPYLVMKNYALVHVSAAKNVNRAEDFLAKTELQVGAVRSFRHGAGVDALLKRLRKADRVQESSNAETLFLKLKTRRVDAMFSQPPVYMKYVQDLGMKNEVLVQDWTPGEKGVPHGLVLSKRRFSESEAQHWRAIVQDMRMDGTLKTIYKRYLPESEVSKLLDF